MNKNKKKNIDIPISTLIISFTAIIVTTGLYTLVSKQQSSENNQAIVIDETNKTNLNIGTNNLSETQQKIQNQIVEQSINLINQDENSEIKNNIINLVKQRNLPLDKLSFSMINLSEDSCPQIKQGGYFCYISYQDQTPRYPASIVKLFWMVSAYQQNPNPNEELTKQLEGMIIDSDNEASSMVVDAITNTKSSNEKLPNQEFQQWKSNRDYLNEYFAPRGFQNINISQKTFPIPYLNMNMPEGSDLQLRHPNGEEKPFRNYLTSYSVALLLFQIYDEQYFQGSNEMLSLLKRDLNPSAWQNVPYNAIEGFLGQGVPDKNAQFYSKMGWTFSSRNDSAIVIDSENNIKYIFVIFGDDPAFYHDKTFFPEVSDMIYHQILKTSK